METSYFRQPNYDLRFDWGLHGLNSLTPSSDAVVIIDVLSFSTSVDIAVSRGAVVYPYRGLYAGAQVFADSLDAVLANKDRSKGFSLSPNSLTQITPGTRLVLPSPNGSTLSLSTGDTPTLAGCLRNFQAVAAAAAKYGEKVSVIAAGERWEDGSLRPALEDMLGAGAVLSQLPGALSPEAAAAVAVFHSAESQIPALLRSCGSGIELIERGSPEDVTLAAELGGSQCAPVLIDGAYQSATY